VSLEKVKTSNTPPCPYQHGRKLKRRKLMGFLSKQNNYV
jgi:hypothetical protein